MQLVEEDPTLAPGWKWKARYTVLSVLFTTWLVMFMDRMMMSVAIPYIAIDFNLSPLAMGGVMSAFFAGYTIAQIPGGMLGDRFGIRWVAAIAVAWWSVFASATGLVSSVLQMLVVRTVVGLGEGLFPGCSFKGISMWFPPRERATANAVMLASNSVGPAITPLFAVALMLVWGWRVVYRSLFVPGILVLILLWRYVPDKPSEARRISPEELKEIEGGASSSDKPAEKKTTMSEIMKERTVWQCFFILLFFDMTLWGFMTWLPSYLVKARGFKMMQMGIAASLPFIAGTIGCILGGWVSDKFFRDRRKIPIIATQLMSALFLYLTFTTKVIFLMVVWQTLAGACIKFFVGAFWALPMNTVPKTVMGTAGGFLNLAAQTAALLAPLIIGFLVETSKGGFESTFMFLIGAALISCVLVFTLKSKKPEEAGAELIAAKSCQ